MKAINEYKFTLIFISIVIGLIFGSVVRHQEIKSNLHQKVAKCESMGYTWLNQENKCIMIKEFK